jgi:hypothetical protein
MVKLKTNHNERLVLEEVVVTAVFLAIKNLNVP